MNKGEGKALAYFVVANVWLAAATVVYPGWQFWLCLMFVALMFIRLVTVDTKPREE